MKQILLGFVVILAVLAVGVIQLTAQQDKPADPPAPLTKTPAPNQDQLERERQERLRPISPNSTSTPAPGQELPTPFPLPTEATKPPTREVKPPVEDTITYLDQTLKFTFEYPANWIIDAPNEPVIDLSRGYLVTVTNYDPSVPVKRNHSFDDDQAKLQIFVHPYTEDSRTEAVEKWVRERTHPDTEYTLIREGEHKGFQEWHWAVDGGPFNQKATTIAKIKGEQIFLMSYVPADSKYKATLEKLIESFDAP